MALKKSQQSLKVWGKQKWGYVTKGDEKSRNLKEVVIYLRVLELD